MIEIFSKSPLQEKRLYLLTKYNSFVNRKAYTFSIQIRKINSINTSFIKTREHF
jgi:hypothetical protein